MAQLGKKNLTLFQTLRKEKAVKAKAAGNTMVPNLQDSLVDVHVHGGTKRKAELPIRPGKGKRREESASCCDRSRLGQWGEGAESWVD